MCRSKDPGQRCTGRSRTPRGSVRAFAPPRASHPLTSKITKPKAEPRAGSPRWRLRRAGGTAGSCGPPRCPGPAEPRRAGTDRAAKTPPEATPPPPTTPRAAAAPPRGMQIIPLSACVIGCGRSNEATPPVTRRGRRCSGMRVRRSGARA